MTSIPANMLETFEALDRASRPLRGAVDRLPKIAPPFPPHTVERLASIHRLLEPAARAAAAMAATITGGDDAGGDHG